MKTSQVRSCNLYSSNSGQPCDPVGRWISLVGEAGTLFFSPSVGSTLSLSTFRPSRWAKGRKWAQEKSLSVSWQRADLEKIELPESTYGLIVNFNYLQRSLVPQIEKSLKKGGHVIFETYLIDQQAVGHPKNPAYLLGHNELLDLFSGVRVLYYREGKFTEGDREAYRAGLFGQKITKELVHK